MRHRFRAAVAAFALLASLVSPSLATAQPAPPAGYPPPSQPGGYAPQPGMQFEGTLQQSISSRDAWVGEQIFLINVNSTDQTITGARMFGRVVDVQKPGQGRNAEVLIRFDTLQMPNGTLYPVIGEVTHVQVKTANNGAKEVLGTFGGMIIGNILGKWLGTNAGGILGAAGGYLVAKNNREDVTIPANSQVSVRLVPPHPQEYRQPQAAPYPAAAPVPEAPPQAAPPQPAAPQPAEPVPSYARPSAPTGPPGPAPTPQPD